MGYWKDTEMPKTVTETIIPTEKKDADLALAAA
jgi:hypothetical protein